MDKKSLDNQQENVKELMQLIQENPGLEIVPMVEFEVCGSDDFHWWMGSWGKCKVDEYWSDDERIYFKFEDEGSLVEKEIDYGHWNEEMTDDEIREAAEKKVNGYNWVKCICVRIELP